MLLGNSMALQLKASQLLAYGEVENRIHDQTVERASVRMPNETRIVGPGPTDRSVCTDDGQILQVPKDWELLPPGDAALTRRVKAGGATWSVQQKRGRRLFSLGVWVPADRITAIRAELESERSTEAYAKRRAANSARHKRKQVAYVDKFRRAVLSFLGFAPTHELLAQKVADVVTEHATPVGSGTVARTQRIPLEKRAEFAVIAWLRHHTTAYDNMKIARVKDRRREVRSMLAKQSRQLLEKYRNGHSVDDSCPLFIALSDDEPSPDHPNIRRQGVRKQPGEDR